MKPLVPRIILLGLICAVLGYLTVRRALALGDDPPCNPGYVERCVATQIAYFNGALPCGGSVSWNGPTVQDSPDCQPNSKCTWGGTVTYTPSGGGAGIVIGGGGQCSCGGTDFGLLLCGHTLMLKIGENCSRCT